MYEIPKTDGEIIRLLKTNVNKFNSIRQANPQWAVDLKEADLGGVNLAKVNLEGAYLREANLVGANLRQANLVGAKLRGANLDKVNLEGANLESANLEEATLQGAYLAGVNLEGVHLGKVTLIYANLDKAHLKGATLRHANLDRATLRYANLEGASLEAASLREANLEGAKLKAAKLGGANLEGANLGKANLEGATLGGATLDRVKLVGAKLEKALLYKAKIYKFNMEQLKSYGVLAPDQLGEMEIIYDLGTLRQAFSGWMTSIHVVAFMMFIVPYIFYIGSQIFITETMIKSREVEQKVRYEFFRKEAGVNDRLKNRLRNEIDAQGTEISDDMGKEIDKLVISSLDKKEDLKKMIKGRINKYADNMKNKLSVKSLFDGKTENIFFVKLIDKFLEEEVELQKVIDVEAARINESLEKDIDQMSMELLEQVEEVKKVIRGRMNEYINNLKNRISRANLLESKEAAIFVEIENPKIVLWKALLAYILNNNAGVFIILLLYNLLRVALFVKTKILEHREIITGLNSSFTFAENFGWYLFYKFMWVGFLFNLVLVAYNSYYFLNKSVYILK